MNCHGCGDAATAICRFCGRAVCNNCVSPMPFILAVYLGQDSVPRAVVVADAVWCGTCRPQPEPIPMPEMA